MRSRDLFILVVIIGATGLLLFGAVWSIREVTGTSDYAPLMLSDWLSVWLLTVAVPAATLAVVAVLCRDLLAITAAKEAAVEARYREERFRAELVTNVTHDIRTPLTSIVNYVDLIARLDLPDPALAEYTAVLSRRAERLRVLIGDLLEASRVSSGAVPVRLQVLDVVELLGQIAGDLDEALAARDLVWQGPPPGRVPVLADGEHLWRILENLLGNVAKHARPGTAVRAGVETSVEPVGRGVVRLSLVNVVAQPLSVPAEELVTRFTRGDAARRTEGSGLGLFIADRLAGLMGASLHLSVAGEHFVARVDLPAAVTANRIPDRATGGRIGS